MNDCRIVRTAVVIVEEHTSKLIEVFHRALVGRSRCRNFQRHQLGRAHWRRWKDTLLKQVVGEGGYIHQDCVDCKCSKVAPPAFGHSIGRLLRAWHADQVEHHACSLSLHKCGQVSVEAFQYFRTALESVALGEWSQVVVSEVGPLMWKTN